MFQRSLPGSCPGHRRVCTLSAQSSRIPDAGISRRFRAGRRVEARDLRPDHRVLQEARCRERSADAGRSRHVDPGPHLLLRADLHRRRTSRRSIAIARSRGGCRGPKGLSEAQAPALAREGKPLVHIDGGLHSTEVAGPQHTLLLAYDLLLEAERSADRPHPRQRHPDAVADDQSRRPPDGRRLVHEERRHAERDRCRGSTRNTSGTTTTATPTCST